MTIKRKPTTAPKKRLLAVVWLAVNGQEAGEIEPDLAGQLDAKPRLRPISSCGVFSRPPVAIAAHAAASQSPCHSQARRIDRRRGHNLA